MFNFTIKPLLIALGLGMVSVTANAHFVASRTVLNNNDSAVIGVKFDQSVNGDLYLAAMVDNKLVFFVNKGTSLTNEALPFQKNGSFSGEVKMLDVSAMGIPANRYPLYQVVTMPNSDPLNVNNWIGGLNKANISIGLTVAETNDNDGDGFADDDSDHDGYRDRDLNFDGVVDACEAAGNSNCTATPTPTPTPTPAPANDPDVCGSRLCFNPPEQTPAPAPEPTPAPAPAPEPTPTPSPEPTTPPDLCGSRLCFRL